MTLSFHALESMAEKEVEERMLESIGQTTQALTNELQQIERLGGLLAVQASTFLNTSVERLQNKPQMGEQQSSQHLAKIKLLLKNIYTSHYLINRVFFNIFETEKITYPNPEETTKFFSITESLASYKKAISTKDLQHKAVWKTHYDKSNKSKYLTLMRPLVVQEQLFAIAGLHISLESLSKYLSKMIIPWGGYSVLMDAEGKLLTFPYQAETDWQEVDTKDLLRQLDPLHLDASGLVTLEVNGKKLLLSWSSIPFAGCKLLNIADLNKVEGVKKQLISDYRLVLVLVCFFLVFMFFMLVFLVVRRDKKLIINTQYKFLKRENKKPVVTHKPVEQADFISLVASPMMVCQFDAEGLVVACNSAFEHLAGSTQSNLKGHHLFNLLNIKSTLINSEINEVELSVAKKEKISCWISAHQSEGGQGLLLLLDISESKQVEQQLRGDRQRARLAAKMKAEFFQVAVDDANALLANLLQNAHGFDKNLTGYCQAKLIEMQHLLDNMRDMSDSGVIDQQELSQDNLVLCSLVDDCYTASENSLVDSGRRLLIEYGSNIPEYLQIDRRRLFRLMRHLLRQMIQLSGKGDIHLWLGWNTLGRLQLKIQDQGGGLEENERLRRFQSTTPLSNNYEASTGALGLGQLLTRQLVHELQGSLEVEVLAEGGLQIKIELPARLGEGSEQLKLGRVLVVDDGPVNVMLASSVLEKSGYDVDVAASGAEALILGKQKNYNLVLMDIFMPEMDGIETTQKWRELNNANAKVPVIALTANTMELEYEQFLDKGIDGYLTKPYRPNELRELVQRWLEKNEVILGLFNLFSFRCSSRVFGRFIRYRWRFNYSRCIGYGFYSARFFTRSASTPSGGNFFSNHYTYLYKLKPCPS